MPLPIRIGLCYGSGHLSDHATRLADWGFECVAIDMPRGEPDHVRTTAASLRRVAEEAGLSISSARCFVNPLEDDEAIAVWESAIDNVRELGTDLVVGFTGRLREGTIDDNMPRLREVWTPLVKRAADRGVRIAFENCSVGGHWYAPLAGPIEEGRGNLAISPDAWELIFDALPGDHVGLCWEPGHAVLSLADPLMQLRRFLPRVFALDGKDAIVDWSVIRELGIDGRHDRRSKHTFASWAYPGLGDTNWSEVVRLLVLGGFDGAINIEGHHDPVFRDDLEWTGRVGALKHLKTCIGRPAESL